MRILLLWLLSVSAVWAQQGGLLLPMMGNQTAPAVYDPCETNGLVTQIRFTEGTGAVANDSIGSSDLGLTNSPSWTTGPGGVGGAIDLVRASSQYGKFHLSSPLGSDFDEGTVCYWVRHDAWNSGVEERQFVLQVDTDNYVLISKSSGNNLSYTHEAGNNQVNGLKSVSAQTGWHHVAITWSESGDVVKYYFDAATAATDDAQTGTWAGTPVSRYIGRDSGGNYCDAQFADIRIYNTALTSNQIVTIYNCDLE